MKIVLRDNVDGLGRKGDVCEVADGYARNFLMPRGLAFRATQGSEAQADAMRRAAIMRGAADREEAEQVAASMGSATITITAKAGEGGRLFGSVTASDIADAVENQTGVVVDRRALDLGGPIKELGEHTVICRIHSDVEFPITVDVVGE